MRLDLSTGWHAMDLREFGVSALLAAVVLFVAAMVMLNQNVAQLRQSFAWVEQTYAVQKQIDAVDGRMNGVEMTVRGYALTGDPAFLRRHDKAKANLTRAMGNLRTLTANKPALERDYDELERAVTLHQALYDWLRAMGPSQQAVVADAITNPAKRHFKERVNAALDRMEATELRLLAQTRAKAERDAHITYGVAIGIAGLAFLTGTLGFALALFGRRRDRSEGNRTQDTRP